MKLCMVVRDGVLWYYQVVHGGMGWCAVVCMVWWGSDVICDAMVLMVWLVSQPMRCWRLCRVGARDHGALGAAVRDGAGCCDCGGCSRIVRWLGIWRTRQ